MTLTSLWQMKQRFHPCCSATHTPAQAVRRTIRCEEPPGYDSRLLEVVVDWLWPLYSEHIHRKLNAEPDSVEQSVLQETFLHALSQSTATLYIMEPVGGTIRFRGLGRWDLAAVPELLSDPNGFLAQRWGGGKYKVNFHDGLTFVGTHNFRTFGEELWRDIPEVELD